MTETFKASNGWLMDEGGYIRRDSQHGWLVGAFDVGAVRQLFQELRDHELGRWRDTENPDYVVYPRDEGGVRVVDETTGLSDVIYRDSHGRGINPSSWHVAREYFDAHPAHKPLPTEDGLYVSELLHSTLWAARVYRLRDGEWSDVGRPESDPEVVCVAAQEMHDYEGLVPLGIVESEDEE